MPIYYLDNNRGSNANSGLSPSQAWKDLSQIAATTGATSGDAFLLADDSEWVLTVAQRIVPPASWTGQAANPVVIGKYSPSSQSVGNRPRIRCRNILTAADWTYNAPLNAWEHVFASNHINKLMYIKLGGTWIANATDQAANTALASIDGRFNVGSTTARLLLWAPSGSNPVDYYGSVVISPHALGAITLSSGRNCVDVEDIEFVECGSGVTMFSGTTAQATFNVRGCRGYDLATLAFLNGDTVGVLRGGVYDSEVSNFGAVAIHASATSGAGVSFVEVAGNTISDGGRTQSQGAIYMQVRNAARDFISLVHHNDVSGYRWGTRDKGLDGSAIYLETGSDGVRVFANYIHDTYCAIQDNSGRRSVITGNVVQNCRLGIRITDQQNNNQSDVRLFNNTFLVGYEGRVPTQWGSNQGNQYTSVWMFKSTSGLSLTATNNIFAHFGSTQGQAAFGLPDGTATTSLDGNWVYNYSADTRRASDNSSPASVTKVGTTDPTPFLSNEGALRIPDGTLLTTLGANNPLALSGAYISGVQLRNGRMRPGFCPVGACQAVLPRTFRA